ncbi:MAG: hypothetical protein ACP5VE_02340 [Chthonomonadales bacterium]
MRSPFAVVLCLATAVPFLAGCGGGGGGGGYSGGPVTGVWTGSVSPSRSASRQSTVNTLELDFVQNGTNLSGTARLIKPNSPPPFVGSFTGTITNPGIGATVDITITWTSGNQGTSQFHGTIQPDGSLTGTLTGSNADGNVKVTKYNKDTPTNLASMIFSGYSSDDGSQYKDPLGFTITSQDGNMISLVLENDTQASGYVLGDHVTLTVPETDGTNYIDGTLSGNTISGKWMWVPSGSGQNRTGTFTATRASGPASVEGVWTGAFSTRSAGTVELDLTRSNTTVGGVARLIMGSGVSATVWAGPVTGKVMGNTLRFTTTWNIGTPGGMEVTVLAGSDGKLMGTYDRLDQNGSYVETGDFVLSKGPATPSLAPYYAGYYINSADPNKTHYPVSFTLGSQNGNVITGTTHSQDPDGPHTNTAEGLIIGNHLMMKLTGGGGSSTYLDCTLSGQTINGTWFNPGDNVSGTLVLTVTVQPE